MGNARRQRAKKPAGAKALPKSIAPKQRKRLLDLFGKLEWDRSYRYKAERGRD